MEQWNQGKSKMEKEGENLKWNKGENLKRKKWGISKMEQWSQGKSKKDTVELGKFNMEPWSE